MSNLPRFGRSVKYTPASHPCPHCGRKGQRKAILPTRIVYDFQPDIGVRRRKLILAEYRARCTCCTTFRSSPAPHILDIDPRARYSNSIRQLVIQRLLDDNLSVDALQHSLQRDFHLAVSVGFISECLDWKVAQLDMAEYREWSLERFSGALCVDEVHLGNRTVLVAADPLHDHIVAFAVVSRNDQDHMIRFLKNLKHHGFQPKIVITDGSPLYPKALQELWPQADHQLCVFHLLKDLNDDVLDAFRRIKKELFPEPKRSKKAPRGRPRRDQRRAAKARQTRADQRRWVWEHRYLLVSDPKNMTEEMKADLAKLLELAPALIPLRTFASEIHELLMGDWTRSEVWRRYEAFLKVWEKTKIPEVQKALKRLREKKFTQVVSHFNWTHRTKIRTNNAVERMNRGIRLKEKVRYGWRRRRTLVRYLALSLWRRRERRESEQPSNPPKRLRRRPKRANE